MKIDSYGSDIRNQALTRVDGPATSAGKTNTAASTPAAEVGDEVRLSSDAQLIQAATQAAQQTPDVRQDLVERMRAALAKGEVGNDPHALAETLIDHMLETTSQKLP